MLSTPNYCCILITNGVVIEDTIFERPVSAMPSKRLSTLFDRTYHFSNAREVKDCGPNHQQSTKPWRAKGQSEDRDTVRSIYTRNKIQDYTIRKPLPALPQSDSYNITQNASHGNAAERARKSTLQPPEGPQPSGLATSQSKPSSRSRAAIRSNTAPVMQPPDELFLTIIRRRSANSRLERIRSQRDDLELATSLAIASAIPPDFLEDPPPYYSLQHEPFPRNPCQQQSTNTQHIIPRSDPPRRQSAFANNIPSISESLGIEIDEALAQLSRCQSIDRTPVEQVDTLSIISPLNDIDQMYLEKRRMNKRRVG